jgi:signal peptidase II
MAQLITLAAVTFLALIDQAIKNEVVKYFATADQITVIENIFRIRYIENSGAVFGIFQSNAKVLALLTAIIILITLFLLLTKRIKSRFLYVCLVLVVAGGIGNLIDRVSKGYVVDYFEPLFMNFAVFNFADCLVTVGAFAMLGYLMIDLIKDLRKTKNEKR